MELERGKGVALWRQIQHALEQDILEGNAVPGEKLPPDRALAERFGVNRHTVRQALSALCRKEIIRAEQGRGYFVRESVVDYTLARRVRFRDNLRRQSRSPCEEFLGWDIVKAGRSEAEALMVLPGTELVRLRTVGSAGEKPLCVCNQFFPYERFPEMGEVYGRTLSVTASFRLLGIHDYIRQQTRISSRMPTAGEARLLDQSRSKPVTELWSVNTDRDGIPIEYGTNVWAADRVHFVVDSACLHDEIQT